MNGAPLSIIYCSRLTVKLEVRLRMYTMGNCDSYLNFQRDPSFVKQIVIRLAVKTVGPGLIQLFKNYS